LLRRPEAISGGVFSWLNDASSTRETRERRQRIIVLVLVLEFPPIFDYEDDLVATSPR